jgi:hypothetical protein
MTDAALGAVDQRFLVDEAVCDRLERVIESHARRRSAAYACLAASPTDDT